MSPKLKPLLLPQLVEERRKRESMLENEMELASSSFYTQNSSASDIPSPVTPTFSTRGHMRYSSSTSSVESSYLNSTAESPTSPTFNGTRTSKRSLPDVQEEPQERDDDFDMFDEEDLYDCLCDNHQCAHQPGNMSSVQLSTKKEFDYDLAVDFFSDGDYSTTSPRSKKRRAEESPLSGFATKIGTRFPSFSRKWRTRKGSSAASIYSEAQRDNIVSRGASSRSSSISNSARQTNDKTFEAHMPPTPTKSIFDGHDEMPMFTAAPIDIERANRLSPDHEEGFATTPLLPPLMMDASANTKQIFLQSPLQSPSVADTHSNAHDPLSGSNTPIDAIATPQLPGMPSPPLSTRPSVSSFHRSTTSRPGHLVPSSEIPPIVIADPNDEWSNKLGHANFTIYPEPYVPASFDLEACRQLRANWDLARCNYTKHLVRTGEHYGVTSKTYKLTEEKWAATDAIWRANNEKTITHTVESGSEAFATLKHTTFADGSSTNIMTKIPSLNDPRSEGKFPQLGDEDIVGPMVQVAAQLRRSPSKKAKLFKFFAEKFPVGLGRS
ncbi:hypothetical protein WAI453_005855 [Rhynchosporium graminicola]|uniref:Only prolin and serin are matching in the corresponding protein n=1 Tax=Rhynchosporium graminicola TaxID=2792576 RepID=A0A1E1LRJ8_9HELO|nr:uncharacterized protein RCO7_04224 [Rhynchosporium commune]